MFFPFRRKASPPPPRIATVPPGLRIYAIGDIHGRLDLLDLLHRKIEAHAAARPTVHVMLVYLGDYVDRGPQSAGVLERLCGGSPGGFERVLLRGNHEEMLQHFLVDPSSGSTWRRLGGLETLLSYRVPVNDVLQASGFAGLAQALAGMMPAHHRELLNSLQTCVNFGDYFFCHAGVRPGVPLDQQSARDLLWIRGDFLESDADFGRIVVHGHSPVDEVDTKPNRINIDTGAYATNRLSCLVLEGGEREILFT